MRIELNNSGVIFNKEAHTYNLEGKKLSGLTDMIQRQLFPTEYANIPEAFIKRAAAYGTAIHEELEDFDMNWNHSESIEVQDYIDICKENGLVHEASEYTVSDFANFASNIDKVYRISDDTFDIADIKTYGTMTPEKLMKARWQLSCLATLFEQTNPKAKIGRLMVIRLRNKQKKDGAFDHIKDIIFVDRIPSDICKSLLQAEINGEQFLNPFDIPAQYASKEKRIRELITLKESIDEEINSIKADILSVMIKLNIQKWEMEGGTRITRKLPSTRCTFDLTRFKADHDEIDFAPYTRTSNVAGSLCIAL